MGGREEADLQDRGWHAGKMEVAPGRTPVGLGPRSQPPAAKASGAANGARPRPWELLNQKGKKAPRSRAIMGWLSGAPKGKGRVLPYPPIAVQSLHSPIIGVFVQSYSHSPGHRFSAGSDNHARSRFHQPLSGPESRTLPVTRKYRPQRCPFRFRVLREWYFVCVFFFPVLLFFLKFSPEDRGSRTE